ncbi:MAG TPA: triose-phosphate isomerase [Candidatus Dormibacteraeota bacterium]|jgi:triosephosphate isomerase|nr:triose-phosphate isomerase [Candidatus Dormibacteraeota bacterium]
MPASRPLLAANWKMNPLSAGAATELAGGVLAAAREHADRVAVALFPPFPWLLPVAGVLEGTGVQLGAQDCHWERAGAFTGEVSAWMLAGWCDWVIVGHSERRLHLGEDEETVARKAAAGLEAGLRVILCVGEREDEFLEGRAEAVIERQLRAGLAGVAVPAGSRLVVAYEPVWAIGTGRNADPDQAGQTMGLIRRILVDVLGGPGEGVRVLYGGSVNASNVASYVELPACAGCLVGGASLKATEFSKMIAVVAALERAAAAEEGGAA